MKLCRILSICGNISPSTATKILDINMNFPIKDHTSIVFLSHYHTDPKFFEKLKKTVILEVIFKQFVNTIHNIDHKDLLNRILAYCSLKEKDQELESLFLANLQQKIEKWHPLYIDELFYILDNVTENSNNLHNNIIQILIKLIDDRVSQDDCVLEQVNAIKGLSSFCNLSVREVKSYQKIFSTIGSHYLRLFDYQKQEILTALGNRGFCNTEVFKVIVNDFLNENAGREYLIDAFSSVCDVNLENESYANLLYNSVIKLLENENKFLYENHTIRLGYGLSKKRAPKKYFQLLIEKFHSPKTVMSNFCFKKLVFYYYCISINVPYGCYEDFQFLRQRIHQSGIWGLNFDKLEPIYRSLKKLNIEYQVLGEIEGIQVPLTIPKFNTAVIPKTNLISTFDESDLRGEFNLLVRILREKGVFVQLLGRETESTLENLFLKIKNK